jgi:hypothetical protein
MTELDVIYLATPPENIAYIKFIFESYEEVGIIRTVERTRAVIVLLAMPDFAEVARAIVASLQEEIPLQEILPEPDMTADWFMMELAGEAAAKS